MYNFYIHIQKEKRLSMKASLMNQSMLQLNQAYKNLQENVQDVY